MRIICVLTGILVGYTLWIVSNSATEVATSGSNTCILRDGNVSCWGRGSSGVLGTESFTDLLVPPTEAIDLGDAFITEAIDCGADHCCGVSSNKTLKCWGHNFNGQLGQGDNGNRGDQSDEMGDNLLIVDLGSDFDVDHVSCGGYHTCVLSTNDQIKCFGLGADGRLGYGNTDNIGDEEGEMGVNLTVVDLGTDFIPIQVDCGRYHSCALSKDYQIKCWGKNDYGQLGQGDTDNRGDNSNEMGDNLTSIDLGTGFNASSIRCGWLHVCALSTVFDIKCWGQNNNGELGIGDAEHRGDSVGEMGNNMTAVNLSDIFVPQRLGGGNQYNIVLSTNGTLKAWGLNNVGQLGYGIDTYARGWAGDAMGSTLPLINLGDGYIVSAISSCCCSGHSCALLENGPDFLGLKCWGYNGNGQLGLNNTIDIGDDANEMGSNLSFVLSFSSPAMSSTFEPTGTPNPTNEPSRNPTTADPTNLPSRSPSTEPSTNPSTYPTAEPTDGPTEVQITDFSSDPTALPSADPSISALNVTVEITPGSTVNESGVAVNTDPAVINVTSAGFQFGGRVDIGLTDWCVTYSLNDSVCP